MSWWDCCTTGIQNHIIIEIVGSPIGLTLFDHHLWSLFLLYYTHVHIRLQLQIGFRLFNVDEKPSQSFILDINLRNITVGPWHTITNHRYYNRPTLVTQHARWRCWCCCSRTIYCSGRNHQYGLRLVQTSRLMPLPRFKLGFPWPRPIRNKWWIRPIGYGTRFPYSWFEL